MDAKQLQTYKQHNTLLSQFIVRLSAFYEGFSDKIDSELQILRGHLSGTPNFTLATVSINKLNSALQHQELTLKKYSIETVALLESATKRLQKVVFEDEVLQKRATQQLITLNQPVGDIFSIYKLFQQAIELHHAALASSAASEPAVGNSKDEAAVADGAKDTKINPLYKSILEELNQLIASYAQRQPDDSQLVDIQKKLTEGMSEDQLLKSCVVILRMIVQDAMAEASLTGKVIQSLHNSLGKMGGDVQLSMENSRTQFEQRQVGNAQLQSHIESIEEAVSHSESLESLKEHTQFCVQNIASTLNEQAQLDSQGQESLMGLLGSMQSRIEQLQKQTITYKKKLAEQMMLSQTDPLTRLPNRQAYNEKLSKAVQSWQDNGDDLAVAVIDIDHFKSINDRFGHAAGDKTLQVVGKNLKQQLTENTFMARWGGEEFVLLLPGMNKQKVTSLLETMRTKLASLPFKFKQEKVTITASFGASFFKKGDTPDAVFERADNLLYQAKNSGRNRVITDRDE
ncbi:GGDEF domain-containing protein [Alteromonas sp. 38]|uniref:GGDEF domain-containing protein n=1 Tax=Alteromonas TaxID=226 RepID=UPI0012F37AD6|nr:MULTISPECIES: GGDEF domain-containing protein [Alteromonas]CAD5286718.1 GGDEF domain-containing protein [Alteromonas sp. 154]VXB32743.1 GGDEF domain-containing protein [Alteromonas sp. 38]